MSNENMHKNPKRVVSTTAKSMNKTDSSKTTKPLNVGQSPVIVVSFSWSQLLEKKKIQSKNANSSLPGHCFVIMQLFPSSSTSLRCMERLARPSNRCSPACALNKATCNAKQRK